MLHLAVASDSSEASSLWGIVLPLLLIAMILGYGRWKSGRRLGGQEQVRLLRRSIKTGHVVAGADRDRWRAELARSAPRRQRAHVVVKALLGFYAVLIIAALAGGVLRGDALLAVVSVAPLLLLLPLIAYMVLRVVPRQRRATDALERELAADD